MMRALLNYIFDSKPHKKLDELPTQTYPTETELPPSLINHRKAEDKAWEDLNKACKFLASLVVTCMVAWIFFALSLIFQGH